jgi:hypothetical protein
MKIVECGMTPDHAMARTVAAQKPLPNINIGKIHRFFWLSTAGARE